MNPIFYLEQTTCFFFFQAKDGIRDLTVTGVQTCALPISEDEAALSGPLPEMQDLPRPEDFDAFVSERNRLGMEDLDFRSELWESGAPEGTTEEFEALIANLTQAVAPLCGNDKWKLAAVYAGKYGGAHRPPWEQLVNLVGRVHQEAAHADEAVVKYCPQLPRG